ncbi:hypothetical protein [Fictibacillus gelatini]|uniref:hypothetical protein n=1 Tax=Fictibacillus gelatini TaxID=225985 RepID=UPI000686FA46|nr:hypothetical protein [Fictibacillus gelatini]
MAGKPIDISGRRYNRLTVIKIHSRHPERGVRWLCRCDCGNETTAWGWEIKKGKKKSCGCYGKEVRKSQKYNLKHGMRKTRFYEIWAAMKRRCTAVNNPLYKKYYIDKGIMFSPEWSKFENFKNDMYEDYLNHVKEYGEEDTTLDRIDGDKGYFKANCRWATRQEQSQNRKFTKEA